MAVPLRWNFSVQINHIPETAKDIDQVGEQENKKLKIQGSLVGITRRKNSRNKFFLIRMRFQRWRKN